MAGKLVGKCLRKIQESPSCRRIGRKLKIKVYLREASEQDLKVVARIFHYPIDDEHSRGPGETRYIALCLGRIVGHVLLANRPPEAFPWNGCWLFNLVVSPRWRGLGIGEALTIKVMDEAAARGALELLLLVGEDNFPALQLYTKLGFTRALIPDLEKLLEEERRAFGKRGLVMRKVLPCYVHTVCAH